MNESNLFYSKARYTAGPAESPRYFDDAASAISSIPEGAREVDPVGVLELMQFNYMCGSRTLVGDVKKVLWRTRNVGGRPVRVPPIPHGMRHLDVSEAAEELLRLLSRELIEAASGYKRLYVMLTGGLDSRIVAGVLNRCRIELACGITAVSWGFEKSKDVVYARRIAELFNWDFIHVPYDAEWTWENIQCMATWGGAEIAGTHLHGMNWTKNLTRDDLVVAASWGDSVGRAEFSSFHLLKLQEPFASNKKGFIHPYLEGSCLNKANEDIASAWALVHQPLEYVKCEHHQQENYMRRMIGHAMDRISSFTNLHQAFTSDPVVSFMWSLCPMIRDNSIYWELFKLLDLRLREIPWARTGIAPDGITKETNTSLLSDYHDYHGWCRNELFDRLTQHAFSGKLFDLGFLFAPSWNAFYRKWKSRNAKIGMGMVEDVVKLAQIDLAREHFRLSPCRSAEFIRDVYRGCVWPLIKQWKSG